MRTNLREVCKNCGLSLGAHHAGGDRFPHDYCPGNEGLMNWEEGPGTVFKPSGKFEDIKCGTLVKGSSSNDK